MKIGKTIRKYRKIKKFTQVELTKSIGVSMRAVSKWETDVGLPDIVQIIPLCRVLGITADELLGNN